MRCPRGTTPWSAKLGSILRCGATLACLLVALPAHATSRGPEPVALRYSAPEGCPTADAFRELVRHRGSHTVLADESERIVDVKIETTSAHARATVVLPSDDGSVDMRAVDGPDCSSVTDAAALLVALYLDAQTGSLAAPPEGRPSVAHPQPAPHAERPPGTVVRRSRWRVAGELGMHAAIASGLAPTIAYGEWLFLGILVRPAPQALPLLSPSLRLGVSTMRSDRFDQGAHARLHAVQLAFCPIAIPLSTVALRPCALGSAGGYSISAASTTRSGEVDRPWRTWGAGARAEWTTPLSDAVRIELEIDAIAPIVRDRFYRDTTAIHHTPRTLVSGAIGIAVRWP